MKTLLIAHRGAQVIAPENTLSAFALAIHEGFKAVECDVQLTRDHKLVVIHDETLNRTTTGNGWVSRHSYADLQKLQVAENEHIPTIDAVIDLVVVQHHCKLIIEIKADSPTHALEVAAALAHRLHNYSGRILHLIEVHSFWYDALKSFKRLLPIVTTAAIINGGFDAVEIIAIAQATGAGGVSLGYEFLSRSLVKDCHDAKLFVDTWAVSDGVVMKRLRGFGLNAIVENYTGKLLTLPR